MLEQMQGRGGLVCPRLAQTNYVAKAGLELRIFFHSLLSAGLQVCVQPVSTIHVYDVCSCLHVCIEAKGQRWLSCCHFLPFSLDTECEARLATSKPWWYFCHQVPPACGYRHMQPHRASYRSCRDFSPGLHTYIVTALTHRAFLLRS